MTVVFVGPAEQKVLASINPKILLLFFALKTY